MSAGYAILHLSDLHRSPVDPISNDELISALVGDRLRYIAETPPVPDPQALIVSGDLVQGVPLNTADHEAQLAKQYEVAEEFLAELVDRFFGGDRSKVVIVPGNHDVDWNTAFAALEPVDEANQPSNLSAELGSDRSLYRWDWKNLKLYRIADVDRYADRLSAFWNFFERFYRDVPDLLKVHPRSDANLFTLDDRRIGVAAFNSCDGNDCFAYHGRIKPEAIARSHIELDDTSLPFDLRIAVWHHSYEGPPYRTDYMDIDLVRQMIGRGYRLGLFGHQHKSQITPQQIWLPDRERMVVVSAGSLCAGASELPTGVHRQYNILELAPDFRSVRVHVRAMQVANLFSSARLNDFGGRSFAELDWEPPRNSVGQPIDNDSVRLRNTIEQAETAHKSGDPATAVALLRSLDLDPDSYARSLFLDAAQKSSDWAAIVAATDPPESIDELVARVDAFINKGETGKAASNLDEHSQRLQLPEAIATELQKRIRAEEAMRA